MKNQPEGIPSPTELYLCSTPLHILNAVAIAAGRPSAEHHIWLVDQPDVANNPYFSLLQLWPDSPFRSCRITQGQIRELKQKLDSREQVFSEIEALISTLRPDRIYTGNDRRIEFQYAMHQCAELNCNTTGVYVDEGTFTYVGRSASASFSDRIIDNMLKKVTYGFWWKHPPTVGGSDWISEIYAAFPELVHDLLKSKTLHPLQACYADNPLIESFCNQLLIMFEANDAPLTTIDVILTMPHESIIRRIPGYSQAMGELLEVLHGQGVKVGVKYHPRNSHPDILNIGQYPGFCMLPNQIPFEALLPLLPADCIIIGDVSSSLINSRWLKPQARILSLQNHTLKEAHLFSDFFSRIGVDSMSAEDLLPAVHDMIGSGL